MSDGSNDRQPTAIELIAQGLKAQDTAEAAAAAKQPAALPDGWEHLSPQDKIRLGMARNAGADAPADLVTRAANAKAAAGRAATSSALGVTPDELGTPSAAMSPYQMAELMAMQQRSARDRIAEGLKAPMFPASRL